MGSVTAMISVLILAILLIVFLILKVRIHAFVALIIACMFVGFSMGMPLAKIGTSIEAGMGGTLGFLATVLGLGTILGKMLEVSGGAERLARTLIDTLGKQRAHWAMMVVGFIAGIPVFFQVGFVLLIPLVFSIALETGMSVAMIGLPLVIALQTVHSIVPPHPAAMAISVLMGADVGKVIMYGLLIGLPGAIIAGPIFASYLPKGAITSKLPAHLVKTERLVGDLPSFGITLFTVLLPLLIMVCKTIVELNFPKDAAFMPIINFLGNPITALLISVFFAYWTLGLARGLDMKQILAYTDACFGPVAGILLIIGAGGAFNRVLIDSGLGVALGKVLIGLDFNPIVMAWIVSLIMRASVGSATVAMITSAGIIIPVLASYPGLDPALVCVAIGTGAMGLSHVNDSGFWIVKEYFGFSLPEMFKSYTVAITLASIIGLLGTLTMAKMLGQI